LEIAVWKRFQCLEGLIPGYLKMKAAVITRFGEPTEVLEVRELPQPEPGPGQVRVRVTASPINPSDLMTIRGEYGRKPHLPATPGYEGFGVVEAAGSGLLGRLRRGKRVAILSGAGGTWSESVVVSAKHVVPVPDNLPDDQGATFFVNPATALIMVRRVLKVPSGSWLLQTAAGSALGRMVIRLGQRDGFRTVNIVRRSEQIDELKRLGADVVLSSTEGSIPDRVQAATGGAPVRFGLDAVGGATGAAALQSLGPRGRLLIYGTLSGEPIALDPRSLIVHGASVEGFWLTNWIQAHGPLTMLCLFREIKKFLADGVLTTDIGTTFPLEQVRDAVRLAATPGRTGKVLLRMKP
jgi:NADPH:quinone reductase-like Zn-dependent oxidoreductase